MYKFKKECKELLTYLVFEASDEEAYIRSVKSEMESLFEGLNHHRLYYTKKGVQKILRTAKKYIRISKKKETEVELLMHFCEMLRLHVPRYKRSRVLQNSFNRQIGNIRKAIASLHEDLQYDYNIELEALIESA